MRHLNPPLPAWKRSLDLLFCAAVFPVFTLVTLFMAVMVRLTSPGPVLFKQERIGAGSRSTSSGRCTSPPTPAVTSSTSPP
jgi:lipopolysaccharide/colanic/teichoic acid biosynthesis glycosyltransferase